MKVIHGFMLIVYAGISISMCLWVCMEERGNSRYSVKMNIMVVLLDNRGNIITISDNHLNYELMNQYRNFFFIEKKKKTGKILNIGDVCVEGKSQN